MVRPALPPFSLEIVQAACSIFAHNPSSTFFGPLRKGLTSYLNYSKDPAAFLRLTRATVSIPGDDGYNYGYAPVEYLPDSQYEEFDLLHLH